MGLLENFLLSIIQESFILFSFNIQNPNVTKLSYPHLTKCFRETALQWTAPIIFWIVFPFWAQMLFKRKIQPRPLPISILFILKMVRKYINTENLTAVTEIIFNRSQQFCLFYYTLVTWVSFFWNPTDRKIISAYSTQHFIWLHLW